MSIALERQYLGHLWDALRDPQLRPPDDRLVRKRVAEVVERGWAARYMVEDLLCAMGAGHFWWSIDIHGLFKVSKQSVFTRPRSGNGEVYGFEETPAPDLAFALIQVERLGVGIDPSPLVEALRPGIVKQKLVTTPDLHVLWYRDERHKMPPVVLSSDGLRPRTSDKRAVLSTGYKVDVWRDADGAVAELTVSAPRHRRKARWAA